MDRMRDKTDVFPDILEDDSGLIRNVPLSDKEFKDLKDLVYSRIGINLTDQKRTLVAGRLQKVIRMRGFSSYHDYYKFLVADKSNESLSELADRISTNHTYFYREKEHFDYFEQTALGEAMERHLRRGEKDIRIWCAGCSSGEEPYMLVMLMMEKMKSEYSQWSAGVLATDISTKALDAAVSGVYPEDKLKLLPTHYLHRYFTKQPDKQWRVNDAVRQQVTFRRFNLMNQTFPFRRPFDIIFCRNVMIYFDEPTRQVLVGKFHQWLVDGGYLFIGHSETLRFNNCPLNYLMPALYQKGA